MKRHLQQLTMLVALCVFFAYDATAQITSSDNLGIFPSTQLSFNPLGKFTAIGESGGVPGPTADDCDLYGFRAQTSLGNNVNMGIATRPGGSSGIVRTPTILWGDNKRLEFLSKGTASGQSGGAILPCGKRIAYFYDSPFNNAVFRIFGSGEAVGGIWQASDARLKRNVDAIPDAIDIVKSLRGVVYDYQVEAYPELNLPQGRTFGFITQEVAEVMPEAVRLIKSDEEVDTDFQMMQYTQIIPVLTEAIKAQQNLIETQEDRLAEQLEWSMELQNQLTEQQTINMQTQRQLDEQKALNATLEDRSIEQQKINKALEDRLARLERLLNAQATASSEEVSISTVAGVSLRQNRPNPFDGNTIIAYTIPSEMISASLVIYDLNGKALSQLPLEAGDGQIKINAAELSSGVYFYAIENNGETLARQKMVVK